MSAPGAAAGETLELCRRALGGRPGADEAAEAALAHERGDRIAVLTAALRECRRRGEDGPAVPGSAPAGGEEPASLVGAVAAELAAANAALPGRQREALALRDLLGLTHAEVAAVIGIDAAAVGALLARARLALRAQLRGGGPDGAAGCDTRDRALRLLARRQDGESLHADDDAWVRDHAVTCPACERAHAAMLEAAVCYRAWDPGR